jgi:hypothetical protein
MAHQWPCKWKIRIAIAKTSISLPQKMSFFMFHWNVRPNQHAHWQHYPIPPICLHFFIQFQLFDKLNICSYCTMQYTLQRILISVKYEIEKLFTRDPEIIHFLLLIFLLCKYFHKKTKCKFKNMINQINVLNGPFLLNIRSFTVQAN